MKPYWRIALFLGICFLILNSAYVASFAEPTVFYVTNVFAHLGIGILTALGLLGLAWRERRNHPLISWCAFLGVFLALVSGLMIVWLGGTRQFRWVVMLHAAL